MHRHVAIIYGSEYGQTAKIASRMREVLAEDGLSVTLLNADRIPSTFNLVGFDAVIVGSSIIAGKHRKSVEKFVANHWEDLHRIPSAFFSVSGAAASRDPHEQAEARTIMERFLADLAWTPDLMATFGGALSYTKYSPFVRWFMKRIARKEGGSTDTTRDHEMTNWEHVTDFAHRFAHVATPVMFSWR